MSIPILEIDNFLIVSVQTEFTDSVVLQLQQDLADSIGARMVYGVVIDLTAVDLIDSFISRTLGNIGRMTTLMGVQTVVTGIQPAVAITLVEMGISLEGVRIALNLQDGVDMLRSLQKEG